MVPPAQDDPVCLGLETLFLPTCVSFVLVVEGVINVLPAGVDSMEARIGVVENQAGVLGPICDVPQWGSSDAVHHIPPVVCEAVPRPSSCN